MNLPSLFRGNNDFWSADPFRRFSQLQRQMDDLFQDITSTPALSGTWGGQSFLPSCDLTEVEDHYVLRMDIPGMSKDDIKIEMRGSQLSISGERKEEAEEETMGNYRSERSYGAFERTFTLPEDVKAEHISSEYKDGVLSIAIPKMAASKSHQIKIGESKPGLFDRLLKRNQKTIGVKGAEKVA